MKRRYFLGLHGVLSGKYAHVLHLSSLVIELKYWNARSRRPAGFMPSSRGRPCRLSSQQQLPAACPDRSTCTTNMTFLLPGMFF